MFNLMAEIGSSGKGHGTKLARVQEVPGQQFQRYSLIFMQSCMESGDGCEDPYGFLPT